MKFEAREYSSEEIESMNDKYRSKCFSVKYSVDGSCKIKQGKIKNFSDTGIIFSTTEHDVLVLAYIFNPDFDELSGEEARTIEEKLKDSL